MPSIRHHLTIARALLTSTEAHLESALAHAFAANYDPNWTAAIQRALTNTQADAIQVNNITTCIEHPVPLTRPEEE